MEIVLVLFAAFIVWHFIPQRDPNQPEPHFRKETRAVESDPEWSSYIEEHCESPAETAFLRAMIRAFGLKPVGGVLTGSGLRLDFQVEEGCYRVDFLADQWLVIEIDGAAYHSSDEAIARDKSRDEYFESLGYSVLRIPAKVVFATPEEAVRRVRSALQVGKRPRPAQIRKSGWQRLSETMSSISNGIEDANEHTRRSRVVRLELEPARSAFELEKLVIESAIRSARRELSQEDWLCRQDEHTRTIYRNNLADVRKEIAAARDELCLESKSTLNAELLIFPTAPILKDVTEYKDTIESAYVAMAKERNEFLNSQRLILASDERLKGPFVQGLWRLGISIRSDCARAVMGGVSP